MVSAHRIQTRRDIIKPLQFVTEGDSAASPALFGVCPATPSFKALGHMKDLNLQPDIQRIDVSVLGSEDVVNTILTSKMYAFQVTYEPTDDIPIAYAVNAAGGVGTIDESYTMMYSERINGTENFVYIYGCRPTNTSLRLNQGVWECTQTWICRQITVPSAVDPEVGKTPVYVTEPTASSISHSLVNNHLTLNGVTAMPESSFSINVTRNYAVETVNGETLIVYTYPVSREVEFTTDIYVKDTSLETLYEAVTEFASSYKYNASKTFTFGSCVISSFNKTKSASGTDAYKNSITVRAETVQLA